MTHVIKISGHELDEPKALQGLVEWIGTLDKRCVLIHGGGAVLPKALSQMKPGADPQEVAAMALRGGINPRLVAALTQHGVQAIGMSGVDLELMYIAKGDSEPIVRFEVLHYLLEQEWLPVLAPIALDVGTRSGVVLNADTAAQMVASALGAEDLTFVVNTPGVMADGKRVSGISARQYERYFKQGLIDQRYASVVRAAAWAAPYVGSVRITNIVSLMAGAATMVVA